MSHIDIVLNLHNILVQYIDLLLRFNLSTLSLCDLLNVLMLKWSWCQRGL